MQRLNVRNIPDEIYQQFEREAARQERSTEAHARYVIAQSVRQEEYVTGADLYCRELSRRLNLVLPLANEAAARPGSEFRPAMSPAAFAEQLGETDPLRVLNWFSGEAAPDFRQAEKIAAYVGCSSQWLKFGEGRAFQYNGQRRLNLHGSAYSNARALLEPDADGNPIFKIRIIRLTNENGNVLILREFRNTLRTDFFYTNLDLSGNTGNGGFHDLCDFFCLLQQLYIFYASNDIFIKSYDAAESRLKYVFEENDCHPLRVIDQCCQENIWWEDIWQRDMLGQRNASRGGYFWPGDREWIDSIMTYLENSGKLIDGETLENMTRFSLGTNEEKQKYQLASDGEKSVRKEYE